MIMDLIFIPIFKIIADPVYRPVGEFVQAIYPMLLPILQIFK